MRLCFIMELVWANCKADPAAGPKAWKSQPAKGSLTAPAQLGFAGRPLNCTKPGFGNNYWSSAKCTEINWRDKSKAKQTGEGEACNTHIGMLMVISKEPGFREQTINISSPHPFHTAHQWQWAELEKHKVCKSIFSETLPTCKNQHTLQEEKALFCLTVSPI